MGTQERDHERPVAQRLRMLQDAYDMNGRQFAAHVGIDYKNWHNWISGLPLPAPKALELCQRIPGLSLDWLYRGIVNEDMPLRLARRLDAIPPPRRRRKAQ